MLRIPKVRALIAHQLRLYESKTLVRLLSLSAKMDPRIGGMSGIDRQIFALEHKAGQPGKHAAKVEREMF
jgi:hypothetical protein